METWDENPKCGEKHSIAPGKSLTVQCSGISGGFVFIVLEGQVQKLSLCEVQVHAREEAHKDGMDIAGTDDGVVEVGMHKRASMSSLLDEGH